MNVYMLYYISADSGNPNPKLPTAIFESEKDAIKAADKQNDYDYYKDWFVKEVPFHRDSPKEEIEGKTSPEKDAPAPRSVEVGVGDQIRVEGHPFVVEQYMQSMGEFPAAYLKSVAELAGEANRLD